MKSKLITIALISASAACAMEHQQPEFESWEALWQNELDKADAEFEIGHFASAAQEYERLHNSVNRTIPATIRQAAYNRIVDMSQRNMPRTNRVSAREKMIQEQQSRKSDRLGRRLALADKKRAEGKFPEAAAIYQELASTPPPHHLWSGLAGMRLEAMYEAGQI